MIENLTAQTEQNSTTPQEPVSTLLLNGKNHSLFEYGVPGSIEYIDLNGRVSQDIGAIRELLSGDDLVHITPTNIPGKVVVSGDMSGGFGQISSTTHHDDRDVNQSLFVFGNEQIPSTQEVGVIGGATIDKGVFEAFLSPTDKVPALNYYISIDTSCFDTDGVEVANTDHKLIDTTTSELKDSQNNPDNGTKFENGTVPACPDGSIHGITSTIEADTQATSASYSGHDSHPMLTMPAIGLISIACISAFTLWLGKK